MDLKRINRMTKGKTLSWQTGQRMNLSEIISMYDEILESVYHNNPDRELFINDAKYHRKRYLDILGQKFGSSILEVGGDKVFFTHLLRKLNPDADIQTISIDMPYSPYPITQIDIETERFPFKDGSMSDVLMLEVIEHLFRNPSWAFSEINRVLSPGGSFFLTTPNACSYEALQNILLQKNPNGLSQFFIYLESGHHRLWTVEELTVLFAEHGFSTQVTTKDYYDVPKDERVIDLIKGFGGDASLYNQVTFIHAKKTSECSRPVYPRLLYPNDVPVQPSETIRRWFLVNQGRGNST